MSERRTPGAVVVTVVRPSTAAGAPAPSSAPVVFAPLPPPAASAAVPEPSREGESPYGVPASAVQSCCGRGCRHCRIYWNRMKS